MILPIIWAKPKAGVSDNPFQHANTNRILKITLHSSSFSDLRDDEIEAIKTLHEFANLPDIEAIDTEIDSLPHLEIGQYQPGDSEVSISVTAIDHWIKSSIPFLQQWENLASEFSGQSDITHPDSQAVLADILLAQAHIQLKQDIFVTRSERLLSLRNANILKSANIRTPLEAVKIVGFFLRFLGKFIYIAHSKGHSSVNRGAFYWGLSRNNLPNMWKYFTICLHAESHRHDDTGDVAGSILMRCSRAFEARDSIAYSFYAPQNNDTRDELMYHFDYLTLLLSGIFDAQALIAHRTYNIEKPIERYASFRNEDMCKALTKATDLHKLVSDPKFKELMTLLYLMRNTIHKAGMRTTEYHVIGNQRISYVIVPTVFAENIINAVKNIGSSDEVWGLFQSHELLLEPFTYAAKLLKECLFQINEIAGATDVSRLLPEGVDIPDVSDTPPADPLFQGTIKQRINLLGL